jgi:hypothetical protein
MDSQDVGHRGRPGGRWRWLLVLALVLLGLGGTLAQRSPASAATPLVAGALTFSNVPSSVQSGVPFSLTLSGPTTSYAGTVTFTSSDPSAVLPSPMTFPGTGTDVISPTFTLVTAGTQIITATDQQGFYTTATISVTGPVTHFSVTPSTSTTTTGSPVTFTVKALDANHYVVTTDNDTLTVSSTDAAAILPAGNSITLSSGTTSFQVTFGTGGGQTVTVADTSGHTGTSSVVTVSGTTTGASLSAYPPSQAPSGTITLYGSGFTSSSYVTVTGFNVNLGTFTVSSGSFSGSITVPAGTPTGYYTITAQGNGGQIATTQVYVSGSIYGGASLTASPSTAIPNTVITLTGSGFTAGSTVTVTAFGSSQSIYTYNGTFTGSVTVPAGTPNGTYTITASSNTGQSASATVTVTSTGTATLVASPSTVAAGSSFTLTGSGFGYNAIATITAFGLTQQVSTGAGTFSATITVPAGTASGTYTVSATDTSGMSGSTTVTVGTGVAALVLSPSSGPANSTVSVTGSGFYPNAAVTLTAFGATQTLYTMNGSFTASVTVPAGTAVGTYTVSATDSTGRTGSASFTVTSTAGTLSASPSSVSPGGTTSLSGSGFGSASSVTVSAFGMTQTAYVYGGVFSLSLTVPAGTAAGSYTISATGNNGVSASTTVTVVSSGTLQLSSASGAPGQVISISGSGFGANEQVGIALSTGTNPPASIGGTSIAVTAGANGTFTAQYTVPTVSPGSYYLYAQGQTSGIRAMTAFSVLQSTTPPPSTAALPSVSTAATTRYFASGYTGTAATNGKDTSTETIYLYNPGSVTSYVTTTYAVYDSATGAHSVVTKTNTVAPGATVSRSVNSDVGNDRIVSATVHSTAAIVAEEVIGRVSASGAVLDTSSSLGTTTPGTTWYLAEGYTGITFQEYLTIYNPGTSPAQVQVQYMPQGTAMPAPVSEFIPAQSQVTINVRSQYNGLAPHGSREVAIKVTSDNPVVVDRGLYWGSGSGSAKYGASLAPGMSSGLTTQYFSLLASQNGSQSFVTVLNPNSSAASLTLTLVNASGTTIRTLTATVGATARYTFSLPQQLAGTNAIYGGTLTSSMPVFAEASTYSGGSPNIGLHPGVVAQGSAGVQVGAQAQVGAGGGLLVVYNPGTSSVRVQVKVGGTVTSDSTLAAHDVTSLQLSGTAANQGVLVLSSGPVSATLANNGLGSAPVWGGSLG